MVYLEKGPADGFFIDRFEVTDGEFLEFVEATGYRPDAMSSYLSHWLMREGKPVRPSDPHHPVRHVSLEDARAYARFRGKQIPTAEEWAFQMPELLQGQLPWNLNFLVGAANVLDSGLRRPTAVGAFENGRSGWGCYDLIGNVAEMTESPFPDPLAAIRAALQVMTEPRWRSLVDRRAERFVGSTAARWLLGSEGTDWCNHRGTNQVLGGSFSQSFRPSVQASADESPRVGPGAPSGDRLGPGVRVMHRRDRGWDVGFRCVIRDADRLLEELVVMTEGLAGSARLEAIERLASLGDYPYASNGVLPFVAERVFRSRELWTLPLGDIVTMERIPGERRENLLVIARERLLVVSGRDGTIRFEARFPGMTRPLNHGFCGAREPLLWFEDEMGQVRLVDLQTGGQVPLAQPLSADQVVQQSMVLSDPGGRGLALVQRILTLPFDEEDEGRHRTRLVLATAAAGVAHEQLLEGQLKHVEVLPRDRLLLALEERPLEDPEEDPALRSGPRIRLLVLQRSDGEVLADRVLVPPHFAVDPLPDDPWSIQSLLPGFVMLTEDWLVSRSSADEVLVATRHLGQVSWWHRHTSVQVPPFVFAQVQRLRLSDLGTLSEQFFCSGAVNALRPGPEADELQNSQFLLLSKWLGHWSQQVRSRVLATTAPLSFLTLDEQGLPGVIFCPDRPDKALVHAQRDEALAGTPSWYQVSTPALHPDLWRPDSPRAEPLLLRELQEPRGLSVDWLGLARGAPPRWYTVLPNRALTGRVHWMELTSAPRRLLPIVLASGDAFALDLSSRSLLWQKPLSEGPLAGLEVVHPTTQSLHEPLGFVSYPTLYNWVLRDLGDGELLDQIRVRGTQVKRVVLADLVGDARREPVALLRDGRIVALGPADPAPQRLLNEFTQYLRNRRSEP